MTYQQHTPHQHLHRDYNEQCNSTLPADHINRCDYNISANKLTCNLVTRCCIIGINNSFFGFLEALPVDVFILLFGSTNSILLGQPGGGFFQIPFTVYTH